MADIQHESQITSTYRSLESFREGLYYCFGNGKDVLMNLGDAVLTGPGARSFAELSLSPAFTRRWASLYEVFDDAKIDKKALQGLFVSAVPARSPGTRMILAADATPIVRAESQTARDRTYVHVPNVPKGAKPVAPGWQFGTVVALPEKPSSRTTILDNRRIQSDQTASLVVAKQLTELTPQLPEDAIVTMDGGFGNASFMSAAQCLTIGKIMRTAKNRTFYRPKPPHTGKAGRPKLDGDCFSIQDPTTHGPADQHWSGMDDKGHCIEVDGWNDLHFSKCREASLTLIRINRQNGPDSKRKTRVMWLIWHAAQTQSEHCSNTCMPPLEQIPQIYRLRYCIEHSYRFDKQNLLWTKPRLRTPDKFETWTNVVAAVHNQITIAYEFQREFRMPWANPNAEATPEQIRRGLEGIIAHLGTPAKPTQPRGKAPGRAVGAVIKKAERFKTIIKENKVRKTSKKPVQAKKKGKKASTKKSK
jgi:hypothetical protein